MRYWLKFAAVSLAGAFFAFIYYTLFGPLLGVTFMATCLLAALAVEGLRRQLVRGPHVGTFARVLKVFTVFLVIGIVTIGSTVDDCYDLGGVWNWHSLECRHS